MWGKRILCALLACLLVLGNVPVTALAEEPELPAAVSEFTAETTEETIPETTEEAVAETTEETAAETTEETVAETAEEAVSETTQETMVETEEETLLMEPEQAAAPPEDDGEVFYAEIPFQVNPLYEGIVDPADYEDWEPEVIAPSTYDLRTVYLTEAEAAETIRGYMGARVESFIVYFSSMEELNCHALMDQAMAHTGVPTEGDYLRWQYAGWKASYSWSVIDNGIYQYTITFTIPYYTTAEQEADMDEKVEQLLESLNLSGKSDYEKVKGIYDYICQHITYDNDNLNNDDYKLKYTAYAALFNKTAVCQGYAVLLYRLALELGIDCRFISGDGNGPHGWNIIRLGDKYYNADSTWDAGKTPYRYFLKGSGFNSNHTRDEEYTTDEFNAAYPTSASDYSVTASGTCGENLNWVLDGSGMLTIYAGTDTPGAMNDYSAAAPAPWASLSDKITAIDMQAGTTIGANAFTGLSKAVSIRLPYCLEYVTAGAFVGCTALKNFNIACGETIGDYFAEGPVLLRFTASMGTQVVTVSPSVEGHIDIPYYGVILPGALLGCEKINSIRFRSFRYLPDGALDGCAKELTICFDGYEPPYIEKQAFAGHVVTIASCPVTQGWKEVARDGGYGGTAIWPEELLRDDDPDTGNACGKNLLWTLESGTLIIYAAATGTPGSMTDYSDTAPAPWAEFSDQITAINMQAGATLGANAFAGLSKVQTVWLPDSLTDITPGAFAGCTQLSNFYFMGDGLFYADGPVILKSTASDGVYVVTVAPSVTGRFDVPSYGVILPGALLGCENIRSIHFCDNSRRLPDGALNGCAENLSLSFAGAEPPRIEGNAFDGHVVTISCPVNWSWSQAAKGGTYGGVISWPEGLLDLSMEMVLKNGDEALGSTLEVDMFDSTRLMLSAQILPADAPQSGVFWDSSNTRVATVDRITGAVTLKYPGTTTITAKAADGSGLKASVTLNVIYVTAAKTLTATVERPSIGLQPEQTATVTVSGGEAIEAKYLSFTPSNKAIATVDDGGVVTGGTKTGTVTITVSLKGNDPLKRKVSVRIPVIAMQVQELELALPEGMEVEDGTLILEKNASNQTVRISAETKNWNHETFAGNLKWSSSDTSVAKVDGTGTVTIPANATGECVITAVSNDLNKIQRQQKISVRDYSPRLVTGTLTLNSYSTQGAALDLRESYGNSIENVELVNPPEGFTIDEETRTLNADQVKNGTHKLELEVTCKKGTYSMTLQVKVANTLPSVSVKQTEKINLFYTDSTAGLTISAPGQTIRSVELTDTENFTLDYDGESGAASIRYTKPVDRPDAKATLRVYMDGYNTPVSKAITISTTTSAPKLRLSSTASTINTALGDKSVSVQVLDSNGKILELNDSSEVTASFATASIVSNTLTLTLNGTSGGTATIYVQQANWRQSVKLTHRVTVSTKLPTIKLASTTLQLDRYFTRKTAQTATSLTQSNLTLKNVTVVSTAKVGTSTRTEADKISVEYDRESNCIIARIKDPDTVPNAGTYSYSYSGILSDDDETPISGGTLRVTVGGTLPKVKLSATTVKLNSSLAEKESIQLRPVISGGTGYTLVGFEESSDWLTFTEDGVLQAQLTGTPNNGKYTFNVYPVLRHDATEQKVTLPTALTLTVQVYSGAPKVSLSAKGKLDTLNLDSAIVYTPKLTNCVGTVTAVELDEQYSTQFSANMVDGSIRLTLKDGVQYATNVTYQVRFRLTVCGQKLLSPVMSVKVTQSSVRLTASPATLTLFQSQTAPLTGNLTISAGEIETVAVSTKNSSELLAALGFSAQPSGKSAALELSIQNTSLLKAGKSYTLYLDVTPMNNAKNLKPTQVRLTVKVSK